MTITAPPSGQLRPSRTVRTIVSLDRTASRPWFLPAVSLFPLTDYVLPFLPNQMVLIALSVLQPRRWWIFAATFVIATAFGAGLTAFAIQAASPWILETLFGGTPDNSAAAQVVSMVERYGLVALVALSMLPWPPRTGVIVCALAGLHPLAIGLSVSVGRIAPAGAFTFVGAHAPHLLRRLPSIDQTLRDVEALQAQNS